MISWVIIRPFYRDHDLSMITEINARRAGDAA
jgi:hypothetical protein